MDRPRKMLRIFLTVVAATVVLGGGGIWPGRAAPPGTANVEPLAELEAAWRRLHWVGFASIEWDARTVRGAGGPSPGGYIHWEAAGYGRSPEREGSAGGLTANLDGRQGYRITVAFDSRDKARQELLESKSTFRYPVLGDASVQQRDVASRHPVYVRVERGASYFLYGDYRTELSSGQLLVFDRHLTGPKWHYEPTTQGGRWQTTVMAARSPHRSKTEWLPSLGTVGYYRLAEAHIVPGSERVYIAAPSFREDTGGDGPTGLVDGAFARPLKRDVDYTIDYVDGMVLFRQPVPIADAQGNPYHVVVRYEYESDQAAAPTTAARLAYDGGGWHFGLTHVDDRSGSDSGRRAAALDGRVQIAPWLRIDGEWATTSGGSGPPAVHGDGHRLQLSGDVGPLWSYRLSYQRLNENFIHLHGGEAVARPQARLAASVGFRPDWGRPGAGFQTTLSHTIDTTWPLSASDNGLTGARTTLGATYGIGPWTVRGQLEVGNYRQLGAGVDRWTSAGHRLGAAYRFGPGHELGAFRRGAVAASPVTGHSDETGATGLYYDHRLDERTDVSAGYTTTDEGRHSLWTGIARRVVDNDALHTDAYVRYHIDGTMSGARTATVLGVTNRWQVTEAVAVDFGYERTDGLVAGSSGTGSGPGSPPSPPGTPPSPPPETSGVRDAWNASVSFTPSLPYRVSVVYSTSASGGRTGQHVGLSVVGQVADDWSAAAHWSASTLPSAAGGGDGWGRQRHALGLAYRPVHNSRLNALFAYEGEVAQPRPGGAARPPGQTQTYSAEGSWWATSRLELAARAAQRNVTAASPVAPSVQTSTTLYQVRGTVALTPRWDGTVIYRTLQQHLTVKHPPLHQAGWQLSFGYAFVEGDPRWRLEAGYRHTDADFAPEDDPMADAFVAGPFVRLTYRF